jgi:GTPase SAR1 family protein
MLRRTSPYYSVSLKPMPQISPRLTRHRSAHAFILVYSVTHRVTFEDVVGYCSQVRRVKCDPNTLFILVGNKCDLEYEREVSYEEGAALANELGCDFFETSAKTGENVQPVAVRLAQLLKDGENGRFTFRGMFGRRWHCRWNLFCC